GTRSWQAHHLVSHATRFGIHLAALRLDSFSSEISASPSVCSQASEWDLPVHAAAPHQERRLQLGMLSADGLHRGTCCLPADILTFLFIPVCQWPHTGLIQGSP